MATLEETKGEPLNTPSRLRQKLADMLDGIPLGELPLDYINTKFFGDVYEAREVLGAGSYGIVVRVTEKSTGEQYAVKVGDG